LAGADQRPARRRPGPRPRPHRARGITIQVTRSTVTRRVRSSGAL
jgi:hypothetical protein